MTKYTLAAAKSADKEIITIQIKLKLMMKTELQAIPRLKVKIYIFLFPSYQLKIKKS